MEDAETHKTEWLLKQLSSFGRSVAIDWLRDLDAGRPLTPLPSPYHQTGELRINEDEMLEVLVAPYSGPESDEHVTSVSSMADAVRLHEEDRVWQAVPGLLPQWGRFLRKTTPPGWPSVYGVAKRAREEDEKEALEDTSARSLKRAKLSGRGSARQKMRLHAEPDQKAKTVEKTMRLLNPKAQADPQTQPISTVVNLEEDSPHGQSPLPESSTFLTNEDWHSSSLIIDLDTPLPPFPSLFISPSRSASAYSSPSLSPHLSRIKSKDLKNNHSVVPSQHLPQVEPLPLQEQNLRRFEALTTSLKTTPPRRRRL